jgi:hypothetical protein
MVQDDRFSTTGSGCSLGLVRWAWARPVESSAITAPGIRPLASFLTKGYNVPDKQSYCERGSASQAAGASSWCRSACLLSSGRSASLVRGAMNGGC